MSARAQSAGKEIPFIVPSIPDDGISPEIYRHLFIGTGLRAEDQPLIGITSAIAGEGRTTVALGLARTLALDLDSEVFLVDADLENPSLTTRFELQAARGLADAIRGDWALTEARTTVSGNLSFIPAGSGGADSSSLLRKLSLDDSFHGIHDVHGVVILDLPPILNHAYSSVAAGVTDAVILVVRAGVTPADMVREAIARLEDRPPLGVVFNGMQSPLPPWWPHHE